MIEAAGARMLFLPPYSPDFNPIEKAFSKLQAHLRKAAKHTVTGLWDRIGKLLDLIDPQEAHNFFTSCGYDPAWKWKRSIFACKVCAVYAPLVFRFQLLGRAA
jgi:hypothetical protein